MLPVGDSELRIRVRVVHRTLARNLQTSSNVDQLDRVNEAICACSQLHPIQAVSFTQLQSGDTELRCEKVAGVERLLYNQAAWRPVLGLGARILCDTFTVILHRIQTAAIKANQGN